MKNGKNIILKNNNLPDKINFDYICNRTKLEKEILINDMMIKTLNNIYFCISQLEYESMKIEKGSYPNKQELQGNNKPINFHQLLQALENSILKLEQIKIEE